MPGVVAAKEDTLGAVAADDVAEHIFVKPGVGRVGGVEVEVIFSRQMVKNVTR